MFAAGASHDSFSRHTGFVGPRMTTPRSPEAYGGFVAALAPAEPRANPTSASTSVRVATRMAEVHCSAAALSPRRAGNLRSTLRRVVGSCMPLDSNQGGNQMNASGRMSFRSLRHLAAGVLLVGLVTATAASQAESASKPRGPVFTEPTAFDVSQPLRDLARAHPTGEGELGDEDENEGPPPGEPVNAHEPDGALQTSAPAATIASPLANFEGLRNEDNFPIYGGRVNPPDPVGDVGPSNYVEMVNLTFAVYDKSGNRLLGPSPIGALWEDFPIEDCTEAAGDPIVLYDQTEDRWILTQFTTGALDVPATTSYNCVAVSQTGDPTGAYYRYAFSTDLLGAHYFPDYPKYGVWSNSYLLTSRDFGENGEYGISVYGLEKNKMVNGEAKARAVRFFLDGNDPAFCRRSATASCPPISTGTDGRSRRTRRLRSSGRRTTTGRTEPPSTRSTSST